MLQKVALATIRKGGMSVAMNDGEYRVTFRATDMPNAERREAVAYYTYDPQDAVDTAEHMLAHARRHNLI